MFLHTYPYIEVIPLWIETRVATQLSCTCFNASDSAYGL